MATTKITVNNNGSLKIEGDFEIVSQWRRVQFTRTGSSWDLPLWHVEKQTILRWLPQWSF